MFDFSSVTFEIYIEDKLVQKQEMQAPVEILMMHFIQTMKQIINDKRPLKIRMVKPESIWDKFENKTKILNNEIIFSNNAMSEWEEHRQN